MKCINKEELSIHILRIHYNLIYKVVFASFKGGDTVKNGEKTRD